MKKIMIAAAALVAMTACNKTLIESPIADSEYGYISLGISADTEMVTTKTMTDVTNPGNYNIKIYDASSTNSYKYNGKHSAIPANGVSVVAGNNYVVEAENITEAEAETEAGGYGALRVLGKTSSVAVEAGKTNNVTVQCYPENTEVTVAFESSFTSLFTDYSVKVTEDVTDGVNINNTSRTLDMYVSETVKSAYFNVDNGPVTLKWVLKAKNKDGVDKYYYKTFTSAKATKTTLSFAGNGSNGSIKVSIKAETGMTAAKTTTYTIDPITGAITESNN